MRSNYSLKRTAAYRLLCYHAVMRQRPLSSSVRCSRWLLCAYFFLRSQSRLFAPPLLHRLSVFSRSRLRLCLRTRKCMSRFSLLWHSFWVLKVFFFGGSSRGLCQQPCGVGEQSFFFLCSVVSQIHFFGTSSHATLSLFPGRCQPRMLLLAQSVSGAGTYFAHMLPAPNYSLKRTAAGRLR